MTGPGPDIPRNTGVDHFFEYGLHLSTATIYLGSSYTDDYGGENGIDYDSASKFIKSMYLLETQSDCSEITIKLNNPGGDEFHMFAIYDAIRCSPKWTTIECYGHGMSAGSVIMQAANRRLISPNAYMMIHDGTWENVGNTARDFERWAKVSKEIRERMYAIYHEKMKKKNPNITIKVIEDLCRNDTILTATQSVDIGLADEIIPYYESTKDPGDKQDGKKEGRKKTKKK